MIEILLSPPLAMGLLALFVLKIAIDQTLNRKP